MKKLRKEEPCWCKSGKAYGECHAAFDRKIEIFKKKFHQVPPRNIIKNEEMLEGMRASSKINVAVLDYVGEHIKAGMTTEEIDQMVYEQTTAMGGIPAPLNYEGFLRASVLQSTMRYATVSHRARLHLLTVISSMSIVQQFLTVIILIPQECTA